MRWGVDGDVNFCMLAVLVVTVIMGWWYSKDDFGIAVEIVSDTVVGEVSKYVPGMTLGATEGTM